MTINIRSLNIFIKVNNSQRNLLNCLSCVPACQRGLRVNVIACQRGLRTIRRACVPMCHKTCQCFNLACQRVPKRVSIFQTFLLQYAKGNFYSLLLYKKLYILLDIIVIHTICISIVQKSCIILHFYTSCHIKENCVEFFFYYFFSFLLFS